MCWALAMASLVWCTAHWLGTHNNLVFGVVILQQMKIKASDGGAAGQDGIFVHDSWCASSEKSCPKGPDAVGPATFIPQPPIPQGPFTFQTVWAPSSELTST
ncbi:hypothetical protein DEU56DRAFT_905633 [Suillus clintonianus]|uniref:uncharacterized protein n=1 Tax=Suillus clintonianus TaxID=1904413 RepID=UPI001B87441D|nr:uncharacterized protein DEU56DRAFT_905633 [Suillus clintonianus]KAG2109503.1 hypothetical protein DEU56DRAFT_905633 [Suillus clintonianus]